MAGSLEVSSAELLDFEKSLLRIGQEFEQVDDRNDFDVETFGSDELVSALQKFTQNWTDGRKKIRNSVETLGKQVGHAAETYRKVEDDLVKAGQVNDPGPSNGSGDQQNLQGGGGTTGGGNTGGGTTGGGNTGGGNTGGGTTGGKIPTPGVPTPGVPQPGTGSPGITTPTAPGDGGGGTMPFIPIPVRPGGPATPKDPGPITTMPIDPVAYPLDPPAPTDPRPLPQPAPPLLPVDPGTGYRPPTPSEQEQLLDQLRDHRDSLHDIADDLRRRAEAMPPGPERDYFMVEADRIDREAQITNELIDRTAADHNLIAADPGQGRYISRVGPEDPSRVIVTVGDPGGARTFADGTQQHANEILDELNRQGRSDVGVVAWQDYATGHGPAMPADAHLQGAANLKSFVGSLNDAGYTPDQISVMGHGAGAEVAHAAAANGLGASTVVTPTTMGMPVAPHSSSTSESANVADDAPRRSEESHSGGMGGSGMIMGVMALSQIGNAVFFKGKSMQDATKAAADGRAADEAPIRTW